MNDAWNPLQYARFRAERAAPFEDMMALVEPTRGMNVIDLGCGNGELTARLAERLPDARVFGVDTSEAMLAEAERHAAPRVTFARGDIADVSALALSRYELVFSHAALHWVPDHARWMPSLLAAMKPGAQLAIQMPHNFAQPSHTAAVRVASSAPFRERLAGARPPGSLEMEAYAEMLFRHGFGETTCFEKIYGHLFARSRDVVEWNKGTLLTAFLPRLDEAGRDAFVAAYEGELLAEIGEHSPHLYTMRRMLLWARKA
jgi:trans-aconitate 2-methyltransferase